tara:strand:+ start:170 stop:415 length:246 start_codon:yes stop_codon:yes gene_type:complete
MNKVFLIFPYEHEGNKYVEAYPMHNIDVLKYAPSYYSFVSSPSRNQARKYAYKKYIDSTGMGFKKLPISPTIKVPMKEHWN